MPHKRWHIVLLIPQKLRGYLVRAMQFCWHRPFDQFFISQAASLSVCVPLLHVIGLSPSGASTGAAALISTYVDMTGSSSEGCFRLSFPPVSFTSRTSFLLPVVPPVAFECPPPPSFSFSRYVSLRHSVSPPLRLFN